MCSVHHDTLSLLKKYSQLIRNQLYCIIIRKDIPALYKIALYFTNYEHK